MRWIKYTMGERTTKHNWFTRLCRETGLMVHHVTNPGKTKKNRQEVNRQTEQRQLDERTILRRTTIDEIEMRQGNKDQ